MQKISLTEPSGTGRTSKLLQVSMWDQKSLSDMNICLYTHAAHSRRDSASGMFTDGGGVHTFMTECSIC